MDALDALAQQFRRFSDLECGTAPLYRHLTAAIAGDAEMLALADSARAVPKVNMLLAAVHCLLLSGVEHPVREFYASLCVQPRPPEEAWPFFREFCLQHSAGLAPLLGARRVQTNEVARAALLLPGFGLVANREPGRALALVEVGTSAGLLLLWDRYAYDFGAASLGDETGALRIRCAVRGERAVPLPERFPVVASRVGIDLNPVNVGNPDEALWLKALVWPDQVERMERLSQAIRLAQLEPPHLIKGDAVDLLPAVLAGAAPPDAAPVVFHCFTLNQFPRELKQRFVALLAAHSVERPLYQLSVEYFGEQQPCLRLATYAGGSLAGQEVLAVCQPHGQWIEWRAGG